MGGRTCRSPSMMQMDSKQREKVVSGSDFAKYQWHASRICGAAVLWYWGARIQTIALVRGRLPPAIAKAYCHRQHECSREPCMGLPVPVDWVGRGAEGEFGYKSEERAVDSMWAKWIRVDLRDGHTERRDTGGEAPNNDKAMEEDPVGGACLYQGQRIRRQIQQRRGVRLYGQ